MFFGGIRMTLFKPTLRKLVGYDENTPIWAKIVAAILTGGIAITIANPTDTIKTKLQY